MSPRQNPAAELAIQRRYLDSLGSEFDHPIFNARQAIKSQRASGYRNTARAAREIIDNSIEAGAKNIWVTFETVADRRSGGRGEGTKRKHANTVTAVAFIDDGPGMLHAPGEKRSMLRTSLCLGGGTRASNPRFIGKFGFGLPNASLNQTEHVQVFSRTDPKMPWNMCYLDIRDGSTMLSVSDGVVRVPEPVAVTDLPDFVKTFIANRKIKIGSGTIVVWQDPDRLYRSSREELRKHMERDFECVYRHLLGEHNVHVDSDDPLKSLDPLFLNPDASWYVPENEGGAHCLMDETVQVLAYRDRAGMWNLETVGSVAGHDAVLNRTIDRSLEDAAALVKSPTEDVVDPVLTDISVRMSYLPYPYFMTNVVETINKDATLPHATQRHAAKSGRYGISFVRAGREIDTFDALPKGEDSRRPEYGNWPVLQAYSLYVSTEVAFAPDLDGLMSVGNDKQSVNPATCLWGVLHKLGVDHAMRRGITMRTEAGKRTKAIRDASKGDPNQPALVAAEHAASLDPRPVAVDARAKAAERRLDEDLEKKAVAVADRSGRPVVEERKQIELSLGRMRFAIDDQWSAPGGVFMQPVIRDAGQIVVRINRSHPWFKFYDQADLAGRSALNLLLIALAKGELDRQFEALPGAEPEEDASGFTPRPSYYDAIIWLRESSVSQFLRDSGRVLDRTLPSGPEGEEFAGDPDLESQPPLQ